MRVSIGQARDPIPHTGLVEHACGFGIVAMAPVRIFSDGPRHVRLSFEAERIFERQ